MPIPSEIRRFEIFLSSPGDVAPEREIAERVIARLGAIWKDHVLLRAVRWENADYEASKSFQESIGAMSAYDMVLGILWRHIGSPLAPDLFARADGSPYESGTALELETALAARESTGKPAVYLFRKAAGAPPDGGPERAQFDALEAWWRRITRDEHGYFRRSYQRFETLEKYEARLERLLETYLRSAGIIPAGPAWNINARGSPYPGLLPYDGAYSEVFFGRSLAIATALDELIAAAGSGVPAIFVAGPSGSGKSSLVRAGIVPALTDGRVAGVDLWRSVLIEPAEEPPAALAERLFARDAVPELRAAGEPGAFAAQLTRAPAEAAAAVLAALARAGEAERRRVGGGRVPVVRLAIVLDQLETLFESPDCAAVSAFLRALVEGGGAWLVATLRSDRYADLQGDADLLALRRRGVLFDLPPPGRSEIDDIVKGPARSAGLVFERRDGVSLAGTIGAAVQYADALPLLQMTLARLFDARRGETLTFEAYEAMGRLDGAIAAHAEAVFGSVPAAAQARLDGVLHALVADIGDDGRLTLRTARYAALAADPATRELVDAFVDARLLVRADGDVRIAHEALLRRWQRAAQSPAMQAEALRLRRQIEPNYATWAAGGLTSDLLQTGTTLAAAERIVVEHPGAFPPEIDDYVRRSAAAVAARLNAEREEARAEARRARRRSVAASIAAVVLAALAVVALISYGTANANYLLALQTKARQLLSDQRPTELLTVAGSLSSGPLAELLARYHVGNASPDEGVVVKTIADIARPAAQAPLRMWKIAGTAGATALALSHDGTRVAVGYADGQVLVFSRASAAAPLQLTGHTHDRVSDVVFGPRDAWIASATEYEIKVWDLRARRASTLCPTAHVTALAADASGRYLAWAEQSGAVVVYDRTTSATRAFRDFPAWADALAFAGDRLVSAADNGDVVVRRFGDWHVVQRFATGRKDIVSVALSASGTLLATASLSGPVDVWTLGATHPSQQTLDIATDKRWRVRFSPDARYLVVASQTGTASVWDTATLQFRGMIDGNDQRVNDVAISPDDAQLLTATESGFVRAWNMRAIRPMLSTLQGNSIETIHAKYSPDGTKFVTVGEDGFARLYDVDAGGYFHYRCSVPHKNWAIYTSFSADGSRALSVGLAQGAHGPADVIKIWSTATCAVAPIVLDLDGAYVDPATFSPAANVVAWGRSDGTIRIATLDGNAATQRALPRVHTAFVRALAFSRDGSELASVADDGAAVLWTFARGGVTERKFVPGAPAASGAPQPALGTVDISPDGRYLVAGGDDIPVYVWDLTQPAVAPRALDVPGGANHVAFNHDGSLLGVGSDEKVVTMWSTGSWQKTFQLDSLSGERSVYDFNPVRGDLAFDGENGVVRVYPNSGGAGGGGAGALHGMDVTFDDVAPNVPPATDVIASVATACRR